MMSPSSPLDPVAQPHAVAAWVLGMVNSDRDLWRRIQVVSDTMIDQIIYQAFRPHMDSIAYMTGKICVVSRA